MCPNSFEHVHVHAHYSTCTCIYMYLLVHIIHVFILNFVFVTTPLLSFFCLQTLIIESFHSFVDTLGVFYYFVGFLNWPIISFRLKHLLKLFFLIIMNIHTCTVCTCTCITSQFCSLLSIMYMYSMLCFMFACVVYQENVWRACTLYMYLYNYFAQNESLCM